jgi:hypothetical protein
MRRLLRWYGAGPLHLLTMIGCAALAGYAAVELLPNNWFGIPLWFVGAVIGHDLLLMPLYTLADRPVTAVFRHRPARLSAGSVNYVRVPAALSGLLLLIWFPLIFRLPSRFQFTTTLSLDPYLWHWLAVTGALFLLSAVALALRLRPSRAAAASQPVPPAADAPPVPATSPQPPPGNAPPAPAGPAAPPPAAAAPPAAATSPQPPAGAAAPPAAGLPQPPADNVPPAPATNPQPDPRPPADNANHTPE